MKNIIITIALVFAMNPSFAQAPEKVNYQAVARDLSGAPLINTTVNLTFEILQGSSTGAVAFTESQTKTTNQFGLFSAEIGSVNTAAFPSIAWGANTYFLRITVNGDVMPATQLLSVPYALYSKVSGNGPAGLDGINCWDLNGNGINDPSEDVNGDTFFNGLDCKGDSGVAGNDGVDGVDGADGIGIEWIGTFASAPAGPSLNDAYYDSTLGQSFIWDGTSWQQIAQDGTTATFVAGNGINIVGNTISAIDASGTNEIQTLSIANDTIFLTNGGHAVLPSTSGIDADADGWPSTMDLDDSNGSITFFDGDNDPANEIQSLSWNTSDSNLIELSNGNTLPLSSNTPSTNQILTWNGANWVAQNPGSGADNWGTQVVISDSTLSGDGSAGSPLSGFDGQYSSLSGAPSNVSGFANDAGYLTSFTEVDGSTTNEIQNLSNSGNAINISGGTGAMISSVAPATGDYLYWDGLSWVSQPVPAGSDNQDLSLAGNSLSLTNDVTPVDLTPFMDNTDAQTLTYNSGTQNLSISGGNALTLLVDDADASVSNETITSFNVNGTSDSLVIGEAGNSHAVALSDLTGSNAWTKGTGNDIYNNTDSVGIGTNNPKTALQLGDFMHFDPLVFSGTEEYSFSSYNAYWDGSTIRNTTGGTSGVSLLGVDNGNPVYSVLLFPNAAAGSDIMAVNPFPKMSLRSKGLVINGDVAAAGLEVNSQDSASIYMDSPGDGSQATLSYRSPGGGGGLLSLRVPAALSGSGYTLTYPTALPSTGGSSLVSDLNGNLSWTAPSAPASFWSSTNSGSIHPTALGDAIGIGTISPISSLQIGTRLHIDSVIGPGGEVMSIFSNNLLWNGANFIRTVSGSGVFTYIGGHEYGVEGYGNGSAGSAASGSVMRFKIDSTSARIETKGDGLSIYSESDATLTLYSNDAVTNPVIRWEANGNSTGLRSSPLLATNLLFTLPYTHGNNNEVLKTDGLGNLSWQSLPTAKWTGSAGTIYPASLSDNIGIGTNSPSTKLDVLGGVNVLHSAGDPLVIRSATDGFGFRVRESDNGNEAVGIFGYASRGRIVVNDNGATNIMFDANSGLDSYINAGEFGIGTSSPSYRLHVQDNSNTYAAYIQQGNTTGNGLLVYSNTTSNSQTVFQAVGNTTGLYVKGNGDVGIGNSIPSEKLDVEGSIEVDGDYTYESAKTDYYTVSSAAFNARSGASGVHVDGFGSGNSRWFTGGSPGVSDYMYAPVHLPNGAIVTQVDFYVHDGDNTYEVSGNLYFNNLGSSIATAMATTTGSGTAFSTGSATLTDSTIGNSTVDNVNRSYYLRFNTHQSNNNLRVYGVKITYTVTQAD